MPATHLGGLALLAGASQGAHRHTQERRRGYLSSTQVRGLRRAKLMSRKHRHSPEWQWEQALIDAYVDYRWHQLLDPLHEQLHRWERGELTHDDLDQAIHQTHKETQRLYGLFTERREWLVRLIQWDQEWYAPWLAAHPLPTAVTPDPSPTELEGSVGATDSPGQEHANEEVPRVDHDC